jgi:D-glycero-D-manno-heptose 1,7-bisphosphate phosphatase
VLISNQPGIAKGKYSWPAFQLIDDRLTQLLERDGAWLDARYYCFHHPEATVPELRISCECRKPLPGLLLTAARELSIDLETSFFVGDTDRDVLAGKAAGCQPIRIVRDRDFKFDDGVPTVRNLHQAVNYIAGRRSVHVA